MKKLATLGVLLVACAPSSAPSPELAPTPSGTTSPKTTNEHVALDVGGLHVRSRVAKIAEERVETHAGSSEISWRFPVRPEIAEVALAVDGAELLGVDGLGALARNGDTLIRVGHGTFIDATGARTKVPATKRAGEIVYVLPDELLARSAYPAVLDPTISAGTQVSTPVDVASDASTSFARFDGTNFVVAYQAAWTRFARVTPSGTMLDPYGVTAGGAQLLGMATSGSESLVLTLDPAMVVPGLIIPDVDPLTAARVGLDGKVLDITPLALGSGAAGAVDYDGTQYVVVWSDRKDTHLSLVSKAGLVTDVGKLALPSPFVTPLRAPRLACNVTGTCILGDGYGSTATRLDEKGLVGAPFDASGGTLGSLALASDGNDFLVVSAHTSTFDLFRLTATGSLSTPTTLGAPTDNIGALVVAGSTSSFFVAERNQAYCGTSSCGHMLGARVAKTGLTTPTWYASLGPEGERPSSNTSVAVGGSKALVGWSFGSPNTFQAMVLDATGAPTAALPTFAVAKSAKTQGATAIASDGTALLVTWEESYGAGWTLRARRFDEKGAPIDASPLDVASATGSNAPREYAATWDGAGYFLAYRERKETAGAPLYRARVGSGGKLLDVPLLLEAGDYTSGNPVASSGGGLTVVAWLDAGAVYLQRFDASAKALDASPVLLASALNSSGGGESVDYRPSVTFDGKRFLLVWPVTSGASSNLVGAYVDGGALPTTSFPIATGGGEQVDPSAAFDGKETLVTWMDVQPSGRPTVQSVRIDPTGKVLDAAPRVLTDDARLGTMSTVVFDGNAFLVGVRRWSGGVGVLRVRTDGVVAEEAPLVVTDSASGGGFIAAYGQKQVGLGTNGKGASLVAAAEPIPVAPYQAARVLVHAIAGKMPFGGTCGATTDCDAGTCVDGVCCASPCTGSCEACDVVGALGKCTPVVGKPHAARTCGGRGAAGDLCAAGACDGKSTSSCAVFALDPGGVCAAATCTGTQFVGTSTCSVAHSCAAPTAKECAPYRCATSDCLATCTGDGDCVKGATCVSGSCVPPASGARCTEDKLSSIDESGATTSCAPFRCNTDGKCRPQCTASDDCIAGFVCDPGAGTCSPADTGGGSSGGCQVGRTSHEWATFPLLFLGGLVLRRRRRSRSATKTVSIVSMLVTVLALHALGCRSSAETNDVPVATKRADALEVAPESTTTDTLDATSDGAPTGIACNATTCLVAQLRSAWLVGFRFDASGKRLDDHGFVIGNVSTATDPPSVATDGTNFLVGISQGFVAPLVFRVGKDGVVGDRQSLALSGTFADTPLLGWDGKTYVAIWSERAGATLVTRVGADGKPLSLSRSQILDVPARALLCDGAGCVVGASKSAYTGDGVLAAIVDGALVGSPVTTAFRPLAAAWKGTDLVVLGPTTSPTFTVATYDRTLVAKGAPTTLTTTRGASSAALARVGTEYLVILGFGEMLRLDASFAKLDSTVVSFDPGIFGTPTLLGSTWQLPTQSGLFAIGTAPLGLTRVPVERTSAAHRLVGVARGGTHEIVVFLRTNGTGTDVMVTAVDGGALATAAGTLVAHESRPIVEAHLAWDGTNYVVAWLTDARVAFARVAGDATVLDAGGHAVTTVDASLPWRWLKVARGTAGALVLVSNDPGNLGVVRLTKAGGVLDAAPVAYAGFGFYGPVTAITATSAGPFTSGGLGILRFDGDGKPIDATTKVMVDSRTSLTGDSMVTDGARWFAAATTTKAPLLGGQSVVAATMPVDFSKTATTTTSSRDPEQDHAAIGYDAGRIVLAWVEHADAGDELRASWIDATTMKVLVDSAKIDVFGAGEVDRLLIASVSGSKVELVYQRQVPDSKILASRVAARTFTFDGLGGTTCKADADCEVGPCVDGYCCNRKCDGTCEACDVAGALGTCTTVGGKPHGARACAGGSTCAEATCDGFEPKSCQKFAHAFETKCSEAKCDGAIFSSPAFCDGRGACSTLKPSSCAPYACDAKGCLTACTPSAGCASGFTCKDGRCVGPDNAAACVSDGLSSKAADGTVQDCSPYRCGDKGTCFPRCDSATQCAPGFSCDPSGNCVPPSGNDSGGCDVGGGSTNAPSLAWSMLVSLLGAAILARRVRR